MCPLLLTEFIATKKLSARQKRKASAKSKANDHSAASTPTAAAAGVLQHPTLANGWVLQHSRCEAYDHNTDVSRCLSCTRRHFATDTCHFQKFRYLHWVAGKVTHSEIRKQDRATVPCLDFPSSWSELIQSHIPGIKSIVDPGCCLVTNLKEEMRHIEESAAIYRPGENGIRITCDTKTRALPQYSRAPGSASLVGVRFDKAELEAALLSMSLLLQNPGSPEATKISPPVSGTPPCPTLSYTSTTDLPCHQIFRYANSQLSQEVFHGLWAHGDPLLVTDVTQNFELAWDPDYFIVNHGHDKCEIVDCQTDTSEQTTVQEFFKDGVLNIASHFPTNAVPPDLGPKMYIAYGNPKRTVAGSKGSTKLHMDMADALNIMTYAADQSDGDKGCAAWDIFRAADSDKLRDFLREKFRDLIQTQDPIHSQQVYLDDESRFELWRETGVQSYRVYQHAGEAVFIPAGWAHQRCAKLTKEFREQINITEGKAWKEDVLQLKTMMWFAWLSCCRLQE
ncbi:hypothetical protein B0H14DRAFT_2579219 [Mycena olivaceomarginata]|nr:hypothetical protein B0H14DRAFT_2579219 [Mycena olivaceomarginata]